MKVHVLKTVIVDRLGTLRPGAVVEMHPSVGKAYLQQGAVELYETKVIRERPSQAAGLAPLLSASPAAQVSTQTTSSESAPGAKKRKRKGGE